MVFGNSAVIFLHSLVLELLFDEIDIDVMMLFKFDFNHAILNFKTIASMKFNFLSQSHSDMIKELCFVKVKRQKRLLEKYEKIQFHEF